jgi:tripartite-type tricarboxylate transporter receptor subunit TctC
MTLCRRQFLHLTATGALLSGVSRFAWGQAYPSRPVRILVGVTAGSANDIVARSIGQWLSERLGQPFVIENRPGAGSNLATDFVVKSAPDGYTLILLATSSAINGTLYEKLPFNIIRDIAPVAAIIRAPQVMVVHPSVPAETVPELIAYARANPGKINMASAGTGTGTHLFGELFKMMAGVDMVHVPYRGGAPALTDLIAGQVQVMFVVPVGLLDHVRAGRLRALAVTTRDPVDVLPAVPPMAEFLPDYEASGWFGIGAPRATPADVIDTLNREINSGLADPRMKARLADQGGTSFPISPAEFGKFLTDESEKWAKVIRFAGMKAE